MTPKEQAAYRRGQEDMRRRIARRLKAWHFEGIAIYMRQTKDFKRSRVDLAVRMIPLRNKPEKGTSHDNPR